MRLALGQVDHRIGQEYTLALEQSGEPSRSSNMACRTRRALSIGVQFVEIRLCSED